MKTLALSILMLMLMTLEIAAQGLIFDQKYFRQLPLDTFGISSVRSGLKLPYAVSLKDYAPPVQNQFTNKTCLAYSLAAAYTIRTSYVRERKLFFSASYLANQIENACREGISLKKAIEIMEESGMCPLDSFENRLTCKPHPSTHHIRIGKSYKLKTCAIIYDSRFSFDNFLRNIKAKISSHIPVVVAIGVTDSFKNCKACERWTPQEAMAIGDNLHTLVVVGYDDSDEAFELMNSYGKGWGKEGFIKISYYDLYRISQCGFVIE